MKKLTFLLPMFLFCSIINGQEVNYYQGKDTLHIGNEVYRIRQSGNTSIYFSNIKNDKEDDAVYPDGTRVPVGKVNYDWDNNGDNRGLFRAARETFTPEEIAALYNERIGIGYWATPDGTVTDVEFSIPQKPVFFSIPPERWAILEKKIKEYTKLELRGAEKYKYVVPSIGLRFKNVYNE